MEESIVPKERESHWPPLGWRWPVTCRIWTHNGSDDRIVIQWNIYICRYQCVWIYENIFFFRYLISRVCQKSTKLYVYTCWHKPNKDPLGLWLTSAKHIMVSMTTVNQWEWLKYSVLPSATSRLSLSKLDPYLFIVTAKPAKA